MVAFALIGLAMAVLIVANVVSGAVAAGYYRIGVLKSIGLTPAQVVVAYLSRVGVPALAGCVLGVVAGNLLAIPVLHQSADAYGVGSQTGAVVGVGPGAGRDAGADRAGRVRARAARRTAVGHPGHRGRPGPGSGRGYGAYRLAARLRLPRPVGMGLAAPFARPARTVVSLAAIAFGATAVIFAFGLSASLGRAAGIQTLSATVPVQIQEQGPGGGPNQVPTATQDAAVTAALRAQPGTAHQTEVYENQVKVPGVAGSVNAWAFSDGCVLDRVRGHRRALVRRAGPGRRQHRVPERQRPGRGRHGHRRHRNRPGHGAHRRRGVPSQQQSHAVRQYPDAARAGGRGQRGCSGTWGCGRRPAPAGYVQAVNTTLGSGSPWAATTQQDGGKFYSVAIGLVGLLALMVAVAAGLGVLNTVLMTTRDRVHDLGIFKALGMRPGQVLTMVVCWVAGPAVVAAAIAAPVAVALNTATVHAMAGTAHTGIPASITQVFPPSRLALLSLAALAIAVIGALAPASWAARARPAVALRTE